MTSSDNLFSDLSTPDVSTADASTAGSSSADAEVVVYWRNGCGFCSSLFRQLDQQGVLYRKVDIWNVPGAAAIVRSFNSGNETVPTVVVGPAALVNPGVRDVIALAAEHAPRALGKL